MKTKEFAGLLRAEHNVLYRGYLTSESLTQIVECRPWLFEALADYLLISKQEIRQYASELKISAVDYFIAVNRYKQKNLFHWPESLTGHVLEF